MFSKVCEEGRQLPSAPASPGAAGHPLRGPRPRAERVLGGGWGALSGGSVGLSVPARSGEGSYVSWRFMAACRQD